MRGTESGPASRDHVILRRHLYTQSGLDETYPDRQPQPSTVRDVIKRTCTISRKCLGRRALDFFPIAKTLRHYRWRQWLLPDMISGLSVGFLHLPLGLGIGLLASLKPVHGLYTSFFPILVYTVFGTSPHVSMGTNAVIALLTAGVVEREAGVWMADVRSENKTLSEQDILQYKVGVASATCLIGGLILLGMGLLRLGFLTSFLAKSFIGGFTFAAALHVTTSMIVKMLHLKLPGRSGVGRLVRTYIDIFTNIRDVSVADLVIGLVTMVILLAVKVGVNERFKHRLKIPVPIELLVVIVSTAVSHLADLHHRFNISIAGEVPTGLPAPSLPDMNSLSRIAWDAFVMAALTFTLTISLAKLTCRLHDVAIDDDQELVAYGLCLVVGGFFRNFPSSSAPPRAMMLSSLGAKSTLNGVMSAAFLLLVLLAAGQLFVSLPIAMLAAMIIVAMKDILLQVRDLRSFWHVNKADFFIWALTVLCGVLADLDIGLLVGVAVSMVTVLAASQRAEGRLLGKPQNEDVLIDLDRKGIGEIPGVKIFRFEAALYFASQERFKSQLYSLVMNPTVSPRKDVRELIITNPKGNLQSTSPEHTEARKDVQAHLHHEPLNNATQDESESFKQTAGIPRADVRASCCNTALGQSSNSRHTTDFSRVILGADKSALDRSSNSVHTTDRLRKDSHVKMSKDPSNSSTMGKSTISKHTTADHQHTNPSLQLPEKTSRACFTNLAVVSDTDCGEDDSLRVLSRGPTSGECFTNLPVVSDTGCQRTDSPKALSEDPQGITMTSFSSQNPEEQSSSSYANQHRMATTTNLPSQDPVQSESHQHGITAIANLTCHNSSLKEDGLHHVILDCSHMTYIDLSGVDTLQLVMTQFARAGVEMWLAGLPPSTLATLRRAGFEEKVGVGKIFYSVFDALQQLRQDMSTQLNM